jgi:ABC-type nitrate/sulfonate/bicarbonate transport system substrate-binding protein
MTLTFVLVSRSRRSALAAALLALAVAPSGLAQAQDKPALEKLPIVAFPFPSLANLTADIIIGKGFDKANGFAAEPVSYGTGGALWAGVAKGELPTHSMSPFQLQKMVSDGVPIAFYATLVQMASLQVITRNPKIQKFVDLKGGSFAATVGFAEFDYLTIYAKRLGFDLQKDVTIVNATTALAQAQLEANRVDAIMAWEPSATMILEKNKDARVILRGDEAWKVVSGTEGWQLLLFARTDYLKEHPGALQRFLKMYQDVAAFIAANPDEADKLVSSNAFVSKNIPVGTVSSAVRAKRLIIDIRPSWDKQTNEQIWKMLEIGLAEGYIPALPPKSSVLPSAPAN